MYYCKDCGNEFEIAEAAVDNHNLNNPPFEIINICPNCKSRNFYKKTETHCRCCGAKLSEGVREYCSDECRINGEKLWLRELKRRNITEKNPVVMITNELDLYNKAHGTSYSYGQYVSLVRPLLKHRL